MPEPLLKITKSSDGILQLGLNRPNTLNALDASLLNELKTTFNTAKTDPSIKALLIHGEGNAFCAGADIKELIPLDNKTAYPFAKNGQAVLNILENLGKPSLAAIHGFALGG